MWAVRVAVASSLLMAAGGMIAAEGEEAVFPMREVAVFEEAARAKGDEASPYAAVRGQRVSCQVARLSEVKASHDLVVTSP